MRKTFQLDIEGNKRDRVIDSVKHEIRKYLKRERRRALPEGVDYWDFDCKFGVDAASAQAAHLATLIGLVDGVAKEGGKQCYVEILAKHGHRKARPGPLPASSHDDPSPQPSPPKGEGENADDPQDSQAPRPDSQSASIGKPT